MGIKNAEFYAHFKSVEKVFEKCTKIFLKQKCDGNCTFTTFTPIRQTFVLLIIFYVHFLKTFSTDLKSACNSAFFYTFFELKQICISAMATSEIQRVWTSLFVILPPIPPPGSSACHSLVL
jgi:hypothetical protein